MRAVSDLALLDDVGTARHHLDSSGPLLPPFSCMRTEVGRGGVGWAGLGWQSCQGLQRYNVDTGSLASPARSSLVPLRMRSF